MFLKKIFFIALISSFVLADNLDKILLNQIGFYKNGPKTAIIVSPPTWYFTIKSPDLKNTYFKGELSPQKYWGKTGDSVKIADFTNFDSCGTFVLYVEGIGASIPFTIKEKKLLYELVKGLIKAFYYQRASTTLPAKYAGQWSRKAGHPDLAVIIHESAVSETTNRKEGEFYPSPKGWYDAGDYGKYVVNAGITVYQLLLLYELFPEYFIEMQLNIPESSDEIPDILNEIKWEIDWLLTMQDPFDGGIYHKVTSKGFCGYIMPDADNEPRYFIGKSTAATFDFAAICAIAYRIYKKYLPTFADSCLKASLYAFEWGIKNQNLQFRNPADIVTGEYGDSRLRDEQAWAAYELFIATEDSSFYNIAKNITLSSSIPSWQNVGMLGIFSMAILKDDSTSKKNIISKADDLCEEIFAHPYLIPIKDEFYWGSNSVVANQGMILLIAFILSKDTKYLDASLHTCDYLLGKNGVGYCFVTGYGKKSPLDPHHRPSIADNILSPVPGFLVGGPNKDINSREGEGCSQKYSSFPAKAWLDDKCSFTTNEVAINWNSALAFLAGGIDAIFSLERFNISNLKEKNNNKNIGEFVYVNIVNIKSNNVKFQWKTKCNASVSIAISKENTFEPHSNFYCGEGDSGEITIKNLLPSTLYYVKCYSIDKNNNISELIDSFYTSSIPFDIYSAFNHQKIENDKDYIFTFNSKSNLDAFLIYRKGGVNKEDTVAFSKENEQYKATISKSNISIEGISYRISVIGENDTIEIGNFSVYSDSILLFKKQFSLPDVYQLISIPGYFTNISSVKLFSTTAGDTSKWIFFGYRTKEKKYIQFDSLSIGKGGWLYHKKGFDFEFKTKGINPDTFYSVVLEEGWNCIGNPFPFSIFWDNTLVEYKNALIRICDSAAANIVRRQYFTYFDNTSDRVNNGKYLSNRELVSHNYNDSATLLTWKAYWIYAERDSVPLLLNPSPMLINYNLSKRKISEIKSWFFTFKIKSNNSEIPLVIGASESALDNYDYLDVPTPPTLFSDLNAGFYHPEWQKKSTLYIADILNYRDKKEYRWKLRIYLKKNTPVSLLFNEQKLSFGSLLLKDEKNNTSLLLSHNSFYNIESYNGEKFRDIELIFVSDNLSEHLNSLDKVNFSFSQCKNTYRFNYSLPSSSIKEYPVSLEIYSINGKKICTLVNGFQSAGSYNISWNFANSRKTCGIYFVKFKTVFYSKNIKIYILK